MTAKTLVADGTASTGTGSPSTPLFSAPVHKALQDILNGIYQWRMWALLANQDIKLRYRRSVLGPFWLTLSMAITVYSMGFLYSHLFRMDLQTYFPFLTSGMIVWTFISTLINELCEAFTQSENLLKQLKIPYSIYIHRVVYRNLLVLLHNTVVIIPVLLCFHKVAKINVYTLLAIPGLVFCYCTALILGPLLAMLCCRYRDMTQIIKSVVQVLFFMTPVMWSPLILPEKYRIFVYLNPLYNYIDIVRSPLMGTPPHLWSYIVALLCTTIIGILSFRLFVRSRSRIIYWV